MTERRFVEHLPDLIGAEEYDDHPDGGLIRIRISLGDDGVVVLGDAFRPAELERVLRLLGPEQIDQMLCG